MKYIKNVFIVVVFACLTCGADACSFKEKFLFWLGYGDQRIYVLHAELKAFINGLESKPSYNYGKQFTDALTYAGCIEDVYFALNSEYGEVLLGARLMNDAFVLSDHYCCPVHAAALNGQLEDLFYIFESRGYSIAPFFQNAALVNDLILTLLRKKDLRTLFLLRKKGILTQETLVRGAFSRMRRYSGFALLHELLEIDALNIRDQSMSNQLSDFKRLLEYVTRMTPRDVCRLLGFEPREQLRAAPDLRRDIGVSRALGVRANTLIGGGFSTGG